MEKRADLGKGYWQTPSGEIVECGDYHENEAFKQLFDYAGFKNRVDTLYGMFRDEADIPHIVRLGVVGEDSAGLVFPGYLREFMNSDARQELKDEVMKMAVDSSSQEIVDKMLAVETEPFVSLFLDKGAVRYRVQGNNIFIEFKGTASIDPMLKFIQSVGRGPRTQIAIEDKSSGNSKNVSMNELFEASSTMDLFRPPRRRSLWGAFGTKKHDKLLKLAALFHRWSKQ